MTTPPKTLIIRKGSKWRHKTRADELGEAEVEWVGGTVIRWRMIRTGYVTSAKRTVFLENFELVEEAPDA